MTLFSQLGLSSQSQHTQNNADTITWDWVQKRVCTKHVSPPLGRHGHVPTAYQTWAGVGLGICRFQEFLMVGEVCILCKRLRNADCVCKVFIFTARCTLVQSAVLRSHVVRPSVCPSVTLVDQDHIGWKSWKLISRTISPTPSLFGAQAPSTYSQGNMEKFGGE